MTVWSNPHLHTDDRVRRTLCRQHVLLSAVTIINFVEEHQRCIEFRLFELLGRKRDHQTLSSDVLVLENSPY